MQKVINKALRFINCNEEEQTTVSELHLKNNVTPLNVAIHEKAKNIWETIRVSEPDQYETLVTPQLNSHSWFPKSSVIINMQTPQPILT